MAMDLVLALQGVFHTHLIWCRAYETFWNMYETSLPFW